MQLKNLIGGSISKMCPTCPVFHLKCVQPVDECLSDFAVLVAGVDQKLLELLLTLLQLLLVGHQALQQVSVVRFSPASNQLEPRLGNALDLVAKVFQGRFQLAAFKSFPCYKTASSNEFWRIGLPAVSKVRLEVSDHGNLFIQEFDGGLSPKTFGPSQPTLD